MAAASKVLPSSEMPSSSDLPDNSNMSNDSNDLNSSNWPDSDTSVLLHLQRLPHEIQSLVWRFTLPSLERDDGFLYLFRRGCSKKCFISTNTDSLSGVSVRTAETYNGSDRCVLGFHHELLDNLVAHLFMPTATQAEKNEVTNWIRSLGFLQHGDTSWRRPMKPELDAMFVDADQFWGDTFKETCTCRSSLNINKIQRIIVAKDSLDLIMLRSLGKFFAMLHTLLVVSDSQLAVPSSFESGSYWAYARAPGGCFRYNMNSGRFDFVGSRMPNFESTYTSIEKLLSDLTHQLGPFWAFCSGSFEIAPCTIAQKRM